MKSCRICAEVKEPVEFYTGRTECKECTKATSRKTRERKGADVIREYNQQYWSKNKDTLQQQNKAYYESNQEKCKQDMRNYYKRNKSAFLAYNSKRRATEKKATPPWVDMNELKYIADLAHSRGLVIDHIVPLSHDKVCGLHVPANLRCINREWNAWKSNKLIGAQYADLKEC